MRVEEAEEQWADEVEMAQELVRRLSKLVESEDFRFFVRMLEKQVAARVASFGKPAGGLDGLVSREFLAGEVAGLRIAIGLAQGSLDAATELLEEEKRRTEGGDEEG